MKTKGLIFVISGPSGSGKTTLAEKLLRSPELKSKLARSVSLTTRARRAGERQGRDYFFVSPARFQALRKEKKILEWTKYLGYYYATPKDFVEEKTARGKSIVLCLDFKGALKIKRLYPENARTIFILPPSLGTLRRRIELRGRETRGREISRRLKIAEKEILRAGEYDYRLVNNKLESVVKKLKHIVGREISRINQRSK